MENICFVNENDDLQQLHSIIRIRSYLCCDHIARPIISCFPRDPILSSCHVGLSKLQITPTNLSPSVIFPAADFVSCEAAGSVIRVVTNQSLLIVCFCNRLSRHLGHAYWRTSSQSIHHKMATVRSVIANLLRMITAVEARHHFVFNDSALVYTMNSGYSAIERSGTPLSSPVIYHFNH